MSPESANIKRPFFCVATLNRMDFILVVVVFISLTIGRVKMCQKSIPQECHKRNFFAKTVSLHKLTAKVLIMSN